ncbi:hypothetical protein DOTSEDRAFT_26239 [Dothistroma septosporum NZE10]|uniref:Uncharacterized protein n=1 Tax=Dothistroma septosporum (strain NZE10 / CBS 128990) TaxID=675120 RepID=N1PKQ8_DOTSN|nr:hypothetical protein DOTSEDRAFT_26239 [Dothistroma septosporum NZE10]
MSTTDASQSATTSAASANFNLGGGGITITTAEAVGLGVAVTFAIIVIIIALVILGYYCSCCGKRKNRLSTIRYEDDQETQTYPQWNSQSWADWNSLPQTHQPSQAQKILGKFGQSRSE